MCLAPFAVFLRRDKGEEVGRRGEEGDTPNVYTLGVPYAASLFGKRTNDPCPPNPFPTLPLPSAESSDSIDEYVSDRGGNTRLILLVGDVV